MVRGVCAFDIDNTLTCGNRTCSKSKIEAMKRSIKLCREHNMAVEVNTARPPQDGILWGVDSSVINDLGDAQVYSRPLNSQYSVQETKLLHMERMAKKWKVPLEATVLVDDRRLTCKHVRDNGGNTVFINGDGITKHDEDVLRNTLKRLSEKK